MVFRYFYPRKDNGTFTKVTMNISRKRYVKILAKIVDCSGSELFAL